MTRGGATKSQKRIRKPLRRNKSHNVGGFISIMKIRHKHEKTTHNTQTGEKGTERR